MKKLLVALSLLAVVGAGVLVTTIAYRPNRHRDDAMGRQMIFQQVWHTIGTNFYDRDMSGLDWLSVRSVYEQKVRKTKSSFDLYWNVLYPLTAALESSHVSVSAPHRTARQVLEPRASLNTRESELISCAGLVMHSGRRAVASRVLTLNPESLLHAHGVRPGWRFFGVSGEAPDPQLANPNLGFLSTSGEIEFIELQSAEDRVGFDVARVRDDLATWGRAQAHATSLGGEFTLRSLGMTVSLGLPGARAGIVDVDFGSLAERAGVEPGSEIVEFQVKPEKTGSGHFEGKLLSPDGKPYSVSFDYQCAGRDRVRLVQSLSNKTLYLRFDVFEDGAAQWIGDELSRAKPMAVILDLRRNVGGKVSELREVMGRFLPAGTTLAVMSGPQRSEVSTASVSPIVFQGPMAVLVGPNTASAAEISAIALKVHKRATLYGLDSFGNVLQAHFFPLDDGGSLMLATEDVHGPDGKRIENVGVKVDHEVKQTLATVRSGRDVVIDRALADLATLEAR